jgi:hypothetical protein
VEQVLRSRIDNFRSLSIPCCLLCAVHLEIAIGSTGTSFEEVVPYLLSKRFSFAPRATKQDMSVGF